MLCFQSYEIIDNIEHDSNSDIIWARVEKISQYIGKVSSVDELYEIPNPIIGQTYLVESTSGKTYYNYTGTDWEKCDEIPENVAFITISEILDTNKNWKVRKGWTTSNKWSKFNKLTTIIDEDTRQFIITPHGSKYEDLCERVL